MPGPRHVRKTRQSGKQVARQCAEEAPKEGLGLRCIGRAGAVLDLQVGQHAENMARGVVLVSSVRTASGTPHSRMQRRSSAAIAVARLVGTTSPVPGGSRSSPAPAARRPYSSSCSGAMIRAAERWRAIRVSELERRQMRAVREELDHEYEVPNGLDAKASAPRTPRTRYPAHFGLERPRSPAVFETKGGPVSRPLPPT